MSFIYLIDSKWKVFTFTNIITVVLTQASGVHVGIDDEAGAEFYSDLSIMHMEGLLCLFQLTRLALTSHGIQVYRS